MKRILTLLIAATSFVFANAQQQFAAGSIVVLRVGDGTSTLANTGSPVFLDEYSVTGTKLQTIALPTVLSGANKPLVLSGTAGSEGALTRSADGRFLALAGYSTTIPYASSLAATTSAAVQRGVAIVKNDGTVNTSRTFYNYASGNNPRGAYTSDGVNVWLTSGAKGLQFSNGTLGDSALLISSKTSAGATLTNLRTVCEYDGQLYTSTGSGSTVRIGAVGTGLPTDTGKIITPLAGLPIANPSSPYAFFLAKVPATNTVSNVLYIADDNTNKVGGIKKYALNIGGTWDSVGVVDAGVLYRSVTGVVNAGNVTLFAVRNSDSLVSIVDNAAYNAPPSSSTYTTLIADAPTGTVFRGVALAPLAAPLASANFQLNATIENSNVKINWNVENSSNLNNFIIEKSTNGKDFSAIKEVIATAAFNYSFTDNNFNAKNSYYRIKATKQNGLHIYSNTVVVPSNNKSSSLQVFPNPVKDFVVVNHPKASANSSIIIVNTLGEKVITKQVAAGSIQTYIQLSTLANGTYSIVFSNNETVVSKQFSKQ